MSDTQAALKVVQDFLTYSMKPDPEAAAEKMAEGVRIRFTGRRDMAGADEVVAFNKGRYNWVKKQIGDFDCIAKDDHIVVYCTGYLYGEWPDGRPFAGNRYLDRYEVKDGKIVSMDVWNDSAEWILEPSISRHE